MKDQLLQGIMQFLHELPPELIVLIISFLPILELRGSIPVGISLYGMSFWQAYLLGVAGNMIPVLPLLLLFQPLSDILMRFRWYEKMYNWVYRRTMKRSGNVEKYGALGLILFTAVPLPTTGAWTACVAASLFKLRLTYSFFSILIGVMIAGLIMGVFSYSIFG